MAKDQGFYLHLEGFDGFDKKIDFDKKQIRRAMRRSGRAVQQAARKLVGKSMRSQPGAYPGRRTGRLQRSIKLKVSRSGFLVRVAPQLTSDMKQFYRHSCTTASSESRAASGRQEGRAAAAIASSRAGTTWSTRWGIAVKRYAACCSQPSKKPSLSSKDIP
jgi:hypothetical protein